MSVILWTMGVVAALAAGYAAGVRKRSRPPLDDQLIDLADRLETIEKLWKPHGVLVGYSIDYRTGDADVTVRVKDVVEDVVLRVRDQHVVRRKRPIEERLGLREELPPSLRNDGEGHN